MKHTIISEVKNALIKTLNLPEDQEISLDTSLKNDLGIDSISSMDFLMHLEDHIQGFVVNANTLEARHFKSVASISDYIENELLSTGVKVKERVS